MRDDHQRAVEILQRLGQRLAHLEVEVVGRLVEQQQVRPLRARSAPARGAPSRRRRSARPVASPCRRGSRSRRGSRAAPARASPGSSRARCHSGDSSSAQLLDLVLREVADRAGPARRARSRRAARASPASVFTSVDLPAPLAPSRPMRVARRASPSSTSREHRRRVAVAERRVLEAHELARGARRRARNSNANGLSTCAAAMQLHPLQRLDAALRLLRLGRLGAEAVDERLQVRDLPLLLLVRRLLQRELLRALALELRVVAGVASSACGCRRARSCRRRASRNSRSCVISSSVPG